MIAYHFVGSTLRDGRPIPPDGEWLVHDGPLVPCESGLHASEHPFDALKYAPGSTICLVELGGIIVPHGSPTDKHVATKRRILKRTDADSALRRFACDQALGVSHLWDMPSRVKDYLDNPTAAARGAARDAAWAAARAAARDAARGTAWAAAWDAAWDAARGTAWAAAWDAAWDAAMDAARDEFKRIIDSLLEASKEKIP